MKVLVRVVAFESMKRRREKLHLTREELAKKAKVKTEVIAGLEEGIKDSDVDVPTVFNRVRRALGMSWGEVFA